MICETSANHLASSNFESASITEDALERPGVLCGVREGASVRSDCSDT